MWVQLVYLFVGLSPTAHVNGSCSNYYSALTDSYKSVEPHSHRLSSPSAAPYLFCTFMVCLTAL
jgi:hypothetical protein